MNGEGGLKIVMGPKVQVGNKTRGAHIVVFYWGDDGGGMVEGNW